MALCLTPACTKSCATQNKEERVFFVEPSNNATLGKSFKVVFGLEGKTLKPAGEDVMDQTSGHHHILINNELGYVPKGQVVPKSEKSIHYGKAQSETTLTLAPGEYNLCMQFADGAHISYGKAMSSCIGVTVE